MTTMAWILMGLPILPRGERGDGNVTVKGGVQKTGRTNLVHRVVEAFSPVWPSNEHGEELAES
jgi:hypothetical protein